MPRANEIKRGMAINYNGKMLLVRDIEVQSPSARGASTLYKMRFSDVRTGLKVEERFKGDEVVFIYGSKDPSFRYIGLIDFINSIAKISIVIINGADHNFSKMIERFQLLPEEYLFK